MTDFRRLDVFDFEGERLPITYKQSMDVTAGVTCHTYEFEGDKKRDLAIIEVVPGYKTPLQHVLKGERTIEGYFSGKGTLSVTNSAGEKNVYNTDDYADGFSVPVAVGELMQWNSTPDNKLVFYEICYPPYEDGRFENLTE